MPHYPQLHKGLPQGLEPWSRHRRDQEVNGYGIIKMWMDGEEVCVMGDEMR